MFWQEKTTIPNVKNPRMHTSAFLSVSKNSVIETSKQMQQLEITWQVTLRAYRSRIPRFLNILSLFKIPDKF